MRVAGPVEIARVVRRMRGRSQAFLVEGRDGYFYVAKFVGNPLGNRTLISEFVAGNLLTALGVRTPTPVILSLNGWCEGRNHLYFHTAGKPRAVADGLAFGSRCPVDLATDVIFDFLPRRCYSRVANLDDVGVVFAFHIWSEHADRQQFIFTRTAKPCVEPAKSFTAWAIDNGSCFWRGGTPYSPTSADTVSAFSIFFHCDLRNSAAYGARLIESVPASVIRSTSFGIPDQWFEDGDREAIQTVLRTLEERRRHLPMQIDAACGLRGIAQERRTA